MGKGRKLAILGLAVLVLGALSLSACHRHRTPEERADRFVNKVTKELDLDAQQRAKLEAVRQAFLAVRAQARADHDALFQQAVTMVQSDRLDQEKVLELLERHQALQRRTAPPVIAAVAEFHAGLTPAQRAKAAEQLKRLHERMHGHE